MSSQALSGKTAKPRLEQYTGFKFAIQREIDRYKSYTLMEICMRVLYDVVYSYFVTYSMRYFWLLIIEYTEKSQIETWKWTFALSFGVNIITLFLANFFFFLIYIAKQPIFEKRKIYPDVWPWESDRDEWNALLWKTLKVVAINNLILGPGVIYISLVINDFQPMQSLSIDDLPSPFTFYCQAQFCLLIDDLMFTLSHRILHFPSVYKRIHKQHHSYIQAVSICAEYAHPIEFVFGNVIPTAAGAMILGKNMHYALFIFMTSFKVMATTFGHSGYDFSIFPFELFPFKVSSPYHDFHHSNNVGNYGGFLTIWDDMMGSNKDFYAHLDKIKNEQKPKTQ